MQELVIATVVAAPRKRQLVPKQRWRAVNNNQQGPKGERSVATMPSSASYKTWEEGGLDDIASGDVLLAAPGLY